MSRVPLTYQCADRLCMDARAALACCRLVWQSLTRTQRAALCGAQADSAVGSRLLQSCSMGTAKALFTRGLVTRPARTAPLTPLGCLVREVGIHTTCAASEPPAD